MVGASLERYSEEVSSSLLWSAEGSSLFGRQHNWPVEEGKDWAAGQPQGRLSVFLRRSGCLASKHICFFEQRPICGQQGRSHGAGETCFENLSFGQGVYL